MNTEVHLSHIAETFQSYEYPIDRATLADACGGITVLFADGDADLGELVRETTHPRFESADDAFVALQNVLPIEAVGEPGQSDGDA